ncbi:MAG: cytochrome c [Myxococcaceae bacterium]|nr:cytochrome c [Myxococcaceae bacterium]
MSRAGYELPRSAFHLAVAALLLVGASGRAAGDAARGKELFANCAVCHGASGEGNEKLKAPAIAAMPQWYVEAQLQKFQTGARGAHPDDIEGLRMRPMSMTVKGEANISAVAAFVAALAPVRPAATLSGGDANIGKATYAVCAACHGPAGEGNPALKSPPLTQTQDWYLMAQLTKFKTGVRGTRPEDASGATMRPMALMLADEQAMKNVLAYVRTLAR